MNEVKLDNYVVEFILILKKTNTYFSRITSML